MLSDKASDGPFVVKDISGLMVFPEGFMDASGYGYTIDGASTEVRIKGMAKPEWLGV